MRHIINMSRCATATPSEASTRALRIINKKTVSPFIQGHIITINEELYQYGYATILASIDIKNHEEHASILVEFYHSQSSQKEYYIYKLNWDGSDVHLSEINIHLGSDLNMFPEGFNYDEKFRQWIQEVREQIVRRRGAQILSNKIKKELIAAVWHPRRVARLLEEGGWDAVEAM